jgi:hypothetical protein
LSFGGLELSHQNTQLKLQLLRVFCTCFGSFLVMPSKQLVKIESKPKKIKIKTGQEKDASEHRTSARGLNLLEALSY